RHDKAVVKANQVHPQKTAGWMPAPGLTAEDQGHAKFAKTSSITHLTHAIKLLGQVGGVVVSHTGDVINDAHQRQVVIVAFALEDGGVKIIVADQRNHAIVFVAGVVLIV